MDNAHALVIGIADYRHIRTLPQTQDARAIYNLLIDPLYCGYHAENVQLLSDGQATLAAWRQALANLAQRSNAETTVFLYFSGHGGRIETGAYADEYLLPVDVTDSSDHSVAQTAISGAEFTTALRDIPACQAVVVFDCCHAGGIGQPKNLSAPTIKPGLSENYYEALKSGRGRVILASSRSDEYSYVLPGAEYGLFTQHLLNGLRGGAASDDGFIRIFDLFEYLQPRVTGDQPNQHPVFKADLENNFPIALYRGGQHGVVPKDEDGFRFDAYISYVDKSADTIYVWKALVPHLQSAGLRLAISGEVEEPGVARVVNIERGIKQSKRTIIILSEDYLADNWTNFENVLGQTMSIQEGTYRLLPVKIAPIDEERLPARLNMLTTIYLTHPLRAERQLDRLVQALQGPLPRR
ncbi:caspase family protein [candidate division KSB1 bacterium]|nr:caspase family protein [candidate division KSB1 bacterium]